MARAPSLRREEVARAFFRQAEADFQDAEKLLGADGHPSGIIAFFQAAAEKATKAFLAQHYAPHAFFDRLKTLGHEPIRGDARVRKFVRAALGAGGIKIILELEAMQPRLAILTTMNPQYPWLVGLTQAIETPVRFFTHDQVRRYRPPVRRLIGATRAKVQ